MTHRSRGKKFWILVICTAIVGAAAFLPIARLTRLEAQHLSLARDLSNAITVLREDAKTASSFSGTVNSDSYDPYQPDGGWSYYMHDKVLVMRQPAYSSSPSESESKPVYINTLGCYPAVSITQMQQNPQLVQDVVYFVKDETLYRRVTAPPSWVTTCGNTYLLRSCPDSSDDESCPADVVLARNVKEWHVEHDQDGRAARAFLTLEKANAVSSNTESSSVTLGALKL